MKRGIILVSIVYWEIVLFVAGFAMALQGDRCWRRALCLQLGDTFGTDGEEVGLNPFGH